MSRLGRILTLVLVSLLLAGFFALAFHHHAAAGDHDDCPICTVTHQLSAAVFNPFFFGLFLVILASGPAEKAALLYSSFVSNLSSRAPPA
jgi:hypothetical protein